LSGFGQREDLWAFFNDVGDPASTSELVADFQFSRKWPAAEKIVWTGTGKISARTNCRVPSAQDIELNERSRVVVCQLPSESDLRN